MCSGERRNRAARLRWWRGLILLLVCTGCGPLSFAPASRLAVGNIEGYEAPGAIAYPEALLAQVAAALPAPGRDRRGPVYGIAMQNALRGLQAERGLPANGRLDTGTLLALGIDPALLPGGLEPITPDPFSRLLSRLEPFAVSEMTTAPQAASEHSPGRFAVHNPLVHMAAPVAALMEGEEAFCTGFLIGPETLLTAASCLASAPCEHIVARFNFQEDARGRPLPPADYRCREIIEVDRELDYGLVRLAGEPGYDWGYLELTDRWAEEGEPLAVIGHPGGGGKLVFEKCRATAPDSGPDFSFSCDAEIDMAGAPVISRHSRRVVAMVRGGRILPETGGAGLGSRLLRTACRPCEPLRLGDGPLGLTGNGGNDFFLQQGGRLGLLRSRADGWESDWLPAAWLGQWSLPGRYLAHGVDLDGDGAGELVLKNSRWLAIFKGEGGQLQLHWIAHDRIGKWQLGGEDQAWAGDFNGDGLGDLLVFDGRRLGLLLANGRKLTGPWVGDPELGDWRFGRADRFTVGDFNGDGRDDVLVRRNDEAAVFFSRGERLELVWAAVSRLGFWELAAEDEHYAGDFTGDGCAEVLVRREGELALWKMVGDKMEVQWRQRGRLGAWRLGWQDRLLIADFNGDGRDDILIRGNEWIGLLISSGRFFTTPWLRFDRFRGWDLTPFDRELVGDFNRDGKADIMLFNPWGSGRFLSTGAALVEDRVRPGLVEVAEPISSHNN
jgi:V8-like Glu-specific endopeptidase